MNTIYKLFAWLVLTAAVQADTLNIRQIDRVNDVQQNSQQPLVEWYQGESVEYNALMRRANVAVTLPSDAVPILKAWRSNDLNTLYINVTGTLVNTAGEVQVVLNSTQANLPTGMYAHVVQVWQGTNYMGIAASGALKIHYSPAGNSIAYVGVQTSGAITNLTASGAISATRTGAQVWVTSDAVTNRGASINGSPITNGAAITIGAGSGVTTQIVTGAGSSSRLTVSNGATANVTLNFSDTDLATNGQWNAAVAGASNLAVTVSNQLLAASNALAVVDATALATNLTRGTAWGGSATGSGTNVILRASSVASSNIVDNTITVDDMGEESVGAFAIADAAVGASEIDDTAISNNHINANAAIALSKISGGTNLITGLAASNQFYFAANPSNYQSGAQVSTAIVAVATALSNNLRAAVSNEYMAAATVSQNFYRVTNPSNFVSGTLASNIANVAVTNGTASNTTYVAGQLASTVTNTLGELNTNAVRRTGDTHGAMTNRSTLLVQTNVLIAGDSLGSELLTNPNFTSDQSGWALTGGFSWNSGQLLLAAGTSGTVTPSNTPTFSLYSTYRLEYALGQAATVTVTVAMGGETNVYAYAGNGAGVTNVLEIQPRTTQSVVWTFGTASGAPTLDTVSLKKRGTGSLQVAQDVDAGGTLYASNVVAGTSSLTNAVMKTGDTMTGSLTLYKVASGGSIDGVSVGNDLLSAPIRTLFIGNGGQARTESASLGAIQIGAVGSGSSGTFASTGEVVSAGRGTIQAGWSRSRTTASGIQSRIYASGSGSLQLGYVYGSDGGTAWATNSGNGSIGLFSFDSVITGQLITGSASIGMGAATVTNDQSIVSGDGLVSHGNKSITAGSLWIGTEQIIDLDGNLLSSVATNTGTDGQVMTRRGTNVSWETASGSGTFTNLLAAGTNMTTFANLNRSATVRWDVDATNGVTANVTNLTAGTLIGGSAIATGTPVYADNAGITQVVAGALGGVLASNVGGIAYVSATNAAGGGSGEVNSRFVSVTWITNDLTFSGATWYKFWPTNNNAVIAETDSNNLLSASGVYAPGTTGVYMVRAWNDELVGAGRTLSIGVYENGVLLTNHCGSLAHTPTTGPGGGATIGFNADAVALTGSQWSDNGAFGFFCVSVATNTYEVGFIPWQGSVANLYRGHFTIIRVGSFP